MVKYAVMADIKFENDVDRETMKTSIPNTSNKPTWGEKTITDLIDIIDNKPKLNIMIRFDKKDDMNEFFTKVKNQMSTNKASKNSWVHRHLCHHDVVPFRPCEIIEEYVIKDVHRQVGD